MQNQILFLTCDLIRRKFFFIQNLRDLTDFLKNFLLFYRNAFPDLYFFFLEFDSLNIWHTINVFRTFQTCHSTFVKIQIAAVIIHTALKCLLFHCDNDFPRGFQTDRCLFDRRKLFCFFASIFPENIKGIGRIFVFLHPIKDFLLGSVHRTFDIYFFHFKKQDDQISKQCDCKQYS